MSMPFPEGGLTHNADVRQPGEGVVEVPLLLTGALAARLAAAAGERGLTAGQVIRHLVTGALGVLPELPLAGGGEGAREAGLATGTDERLPPPPAPQLAPPRCKPGQCGAIPVNEGVSRTAGGRHPSPAVSSDLDKGRGPLTGAVSGPPCRGDWIRTSDLLNPIQAAPDPNHAKTG